MSKYNNYGGVTSCEEWNKVIQSDLDETDAKQVTFVKGKDGKLLPALPELPQGESPEGYVLTVDVDGRPAWLPNLGSSSGVAVINSRLDDLEASDEAQDEDLSDLKDAVEEINDAIDDIVGGGSTGDMLKSAYDKNDDGVVDDAERLGGVPANEYVREAPEPEIIYSIEATNVTTGEYQAL